jgi:hypothetical protein
MPFVYEEKQAPPLHVLVDFYDPAHGHVAVAPDSFYEDETVVGSILAGTNKQHKYVRYGDAVITYPGTPAVYDAMPPEELGTYFVRVVPEAKAKSKAKPPALAERFAEPNIDDILKEQT